MYKIVVQVGTPAAVRRMGRGGTVKIRGDAKFPLVEIAAVRPAVCAVFHIVRKHQAAISSGKSVQRAGIVVADEVIGDVGRSNDEIVARVLAGRKDLSDTQP